MQTPIVDFARRYAERDVLRLHMPGHKGEGALGVEKMDLTEIEGADVLYHARGIIRNSEENAASIFGTKRTLYSTEGSSLAIRAMIYLVQLYAKTQGKRPRILAGRNAHKTFVTACALLDIEVEWLFPEMSKNVISCDISADGLERILSKGEAPTAVYLTGPDYLGNIADIQGLSRICRKYGTLLLVDNAHGAYLRFLNSHPIGLGADMCCDSAHKTLPVLTGGAYLHISEKAPELFCNRAELAMSLFASTSPSYLILQSLDAANRYLSEGYGERLAAFTDEVMRFKQRLTQCLWQLVGSEALKLTLAPKSCGYTGAEIADRLYAQGIVCEFSDPDFVVMMLTPEIGRSGLARLEKALMSIERRAEITQCAPPAPVPKRMMSMHDALISPSCEKELRECCGKVLAAPSITCPPAIPILVCGERIDEKAIACMEYYGIRSCSIVDNE